jgi:hypothetical protein
MRELKSEEKRLIEDLLFGIELKNNYDLNLYFATEMIDGGMGSINLYKGRNTDLLSNRRFNKCIAHKEYKDKDGITLSVALNTDQYDELFELDIWKVDFSPLICYPV